jgi:TetR/AcrR family transcriptional regulator, copper-responsive repressor
MSTEDRMSGKPQFDEGGVIDAAIQVFWRHGYSAASISDLTQATGLSRSSLYQRFGDKDGLFQEALAAYLERLMRRMETVQGGTARARLDTLLRSFLPGAASAARPAGCLIARSCAELAELSEAAQAKAVSAASRQRQVILGLLRDGHAGGELADDADLDALAWHYLGVVQAVLNLPPAGADPVVLSRMIDASMCAWPVEPDRTLA